MKFAKNPNRPLLFDGKLDSFCKTAVHRLQKSWKPLMRKGMLSLMPVEVFDPHVSATMGRPTKELFSVCGLLLVMDFLDWSVEQAVDAYVFDTSIHYALGIEEDSPSMSEATLFRYKAWFVEDAGGRKAFERITSTLADALRIDTSRQRTDSTHVNGNMATMGQRSMVYHVIQNFLGQLRRHYLATYKTLPKDLADRYATCSGWIFAGTTKMNDARRRSTDRVLADDMKLLVRRFSGNEGIRNMTSFKHLDRVFSEQFEAAGENLVFKKHTGGKVMVNPSDPEAEVGHKGPGYQAQVSQTCGGPGKPDLVTAVIPQGGSAPDSASLEATVDDLEARGLKPETMLADAGYGSDSNVQMCARKGVGLVAPCCAKAGLAHVEGEDGGKAGAIEKCEFGEGLEMLRCPAGNAPAEVKVYNGREGEEPRYVAEFDAATCSACPMRDRCPVQIQNRKARFHYLPLTLRNAERRKRERTQEFRDAYRPRCGIEALFGRLKQFTSLGRLRCRGRKRIFSAIYSIFAMHNIVAVAHFLETENGRGFLEKIIEKIWTDFLCRFLRVFCARGSRQDKSARLCCAS